MSGARPARIRAVVGCLAASTEPLTQRDICARINMSAGGVHHVIHALIAQGRVARTGTGARNDRHRYHIVGQVPMFVPPAPSAAPTSLDALLDARVSAAHATWVAASLKVSEVRAALEAAESEADAARVALDRVRSAAELLRG